MNSSITLKPFLFFGLFLILLATTSCSDLQCIDGNNEMVKEKRIPGSGFDAITLSSDFSVFITHSKVDSIVIEAESNLIPKIITETRNNKLELRTAGDICLNPRKPLIIRIFTNQISELDISGSGNIQSDSIISDQLMLTISGSGSFKAPIYVKNLQTTIAGSGNVELWGKATKGELIISGAGNIDSYGLDMDSCRTSISGSGNNYVFVRDLLEATISGSGSVFYKGSPEVQSHVSGSGSVVNKPSGSAQAMSRLGGFSIPPSRTIYLIY
ncbi:MAG: DUF2807 domain-containing protein [Bacteroidales bacterium]|nr:DUF2807 domain-containing protein [Bacteroidales bacterium]